MEVVIESSDTKITWKFIVIDNTNIVLDSYIVQIKSVGKRTWQKPCIIWDRLFKRKNTIANEPELPQDIKNKALELYISKLKILNSYEWKRLT
jgi:hypothetical protein